MNRVAQGLTRRRGNEVPASADYFAALGALARYAIRLHLTARISKSCCREVIFSRSGEGSFEFRVLSFKNNALTQDRKHKT